MLLCRGNPDLDGDPHLDLSDLLHDVRSGMPLIHRSKMTVRWFVASAALLLAMLPEVGRAQTTQGIDWSSSPEWTALYNAGLDALVSDKFREAADSLELAVKRAKEFPTGDPRLLLSMERLEEAYRLGGQTAKSGVLQTEIDELRTKQPSTGDSKLSTPLGQAKRLEDVPKQGWQAYSRGDFDAAKRLGLVGLALSDSLALPESMFSAGCASLVAASLIGLGNLYDAETWFLKSILMSANSGDTSLFRTGIYNLRTGLHLAHLEELDPLLDSCLASASGKSANEDTLVLETYRLYICFGALAEADYRMKAAEMYDSVALDLADRLDPMGKPAGAVLNSLGSTYLWQHRLDDAERCFDRAIEIFGGLTADDPAAIATPLNNLGLLARERHNDGLADSLLSESLAIMAAANKESTRRYATTMLSRAVVLITSGQQTQGRELILRAIHLDSTYRGGDHPDVARDFAALARLEADQGNLEAAEYHFRKCLAVAEKSMVNHPQRASYLSALAIILRNSSRRDEAGELEVTARQILDDLHKRAPDTEFSPFQTIVR